MEQKEFVLYVSNLLKNYKENHPQYHCENSYCCGLCDKFYPCLFDLLEKIKQHAICQRKENENHN